MRSSRVRVALSPRLVSLLETEEKEEQRGEGREKQRQRLEGCGPKPRDD